MSTRTKRTRESALVNFGVDEAGDGLNEQDDGEDSVMDMLAILKEFQKKTSNKTSSRNTAFQSKKNALIEDVRKQGEVMVQEGEQCKAKIEALRQEEMRSNELMKDAVMLLAAHDVSFQTLLSVFPEIFEDLSPKRAKDVNAASETLETHPLARNASRRKAMKTARKCMETGIEQAKLATDATALIKHYKALLRH